MVSKLLNRIDVIEYIRITSNRFILSNGIYLTDLNDIFKVIFLLKKLQTPEIQTTIQYVH